MWGRMCTTGVGPARSVDRAEDTAGVVLCLLLEIVGGRCVVFVIRNCILAIYVWNS